MREISARSVEDAVPRAGCLTMMVPGRPYVRAAGIGTQVVLLLWSVTGDAGLRSTGELRPGSSRIFKAGRLPENWRKLRRCDRA